MKVAAFLIAAALLVAGPAVAQSERGCALIPPSPATLPGAESFTYATTAGGRPLRIHVFKPTTPGPHPAILFFFGGGWRTGVPTAFAEQAKQMAGLGYVAATADYRIRCRDQSTVPDSAADARTAWAWLGDHAKELGVDHKRMVLSGGSAGGHIALVAAQLAQADRRAAALVLFNPAVDIVTLGPVLKLDPAVAAAISPSVLPVDALPPTIILHGEADTTVPITTVRAFCARAVAARRTCRVVGYPGQNHGFFHSHEVAPALGFAPYDDTMAKAIAFLKEVKVAP